MLLLNGCVRLLVLLGVFHVRTAVYVFGARVYRILLASLRYFLVDDTRVLVILVVLVAGRNVRLTSGADATRSLLVAATSRCNKQRHDRSRQMCVCETCLSLCFLFFCFVHICVREFTQIGIIYHKCASKPEKYELYFAIKSFCP